MESLISEIKKLNPSTCSSNGNGDSSTIDDPNKPIPKAPSPEELEQMITFLMQLEKLRKSDPTQYSQSLKSLGLVGDDYDINNENSVDPLKALNESLLQLKGNSSKFKLPGGNSFLGVEGIEKQVKSKEITPKPGFVIKTKRQQDDKKIFINICMHEDVDMPSVKKKLDDKGESIEGMNIPMSVGPVKACKDKAEIECHVIDIIVHPNVILDAIEDSTGKYRDFVCQLGIQSIEQKYKMDVDKRYKLPKMKYMSNGGNDFIDSQLIQDRRNMPKIEELNSSHQTNKNKSSISNNNKSKIEEVVFVAPDVDLVHKLLWTSVSGECIQAVDIIMNEYIDPIQQPPRNSSTILFQADINMRHSSSSSSSSNSEMLSKVDVKISPFKLQVKLPGYKFVNYFLPCAIDPNTAKCTLQRPTGSASRIMLEISLPIDKDIIADNENNGWTQSMTTHADPGSKPWLIAAALSSPTTGPAEDSSTVGNGIENPYKRSVDSITTADSSSTVGKAQVTDVDTLPEDRFHIKLPDNVNKYTGLAMDDDVKEPTELPEDRFHKRDAGSSYYINQREESVKEKRDKHEKEKKERVDDPNVEYVDVDDFKPGGKYGPKNVPAPLSAVNAEDNTNEELRKASEILEALVPKVSGSGEGSEGLDLGLSSTLWTELL